MFFLNGVALKKLLSPYFHFVRKDLIKKIWAYPRFKTFRRLSVSSIPGYPSCTFDHVSSILDDVSSIPGDASAICDHLSSILDDAFSICDHISSKPRYASGISDHFSTIQDDVSSFSDDGARFNNFCW
jgi:hypothetical protein